MKNFVVPSGQLEIDTEDLDGLTITFDKISIPSGSVQMWELPKIENTDEPEYSKEIEGVIVDHYPINAYYEKEYKTYLKDTKNNGNSLIARCPFNNDDKPSFSIDLTSYFFLFSNSSCTRSFIL